jgi:hypothetical protein
MERNNYGHENQVDEALGEVVATCLLERTGGGCVESDRWLTSLRVLLEASQASVSASVAARLLGVSTRTMQRYLRRVGTNFRREVGTVRGNVRTSP